MEKKTNPEFSELRKIPWPPWDPAPDIRQFLDKPALIEVTKLQINYRIKELENQIELLNDSLKLI